MQRTLITAEKYNAMLFSFREDVANGHRINRRKAARHAGVSEGTARRAWTPGWPHRNMPPISEVLEDEAKEVRARANRPAGAPRQTRPKDVTPNIDDDFKNMLMNQAVAEAERANSAREQAVKTREAEARMVGASRSNVQALLATSLQLSQASAARAKDLMPLIKDGLDTKGNPLTLHAQIRTLEAVSRMTERAVNLSKVALEIERLLLGQPTEIVGLTPVDMNVDDAIRLHEAVGRSMERLKGREERRAKLKLVSGSGGG